jgi:hypothetical protein
MSKLVASAPRPGSSRSRASVRQLWVERLARFPTSGLTPAQFCAHEGVSLPSFYSWKRRLAAETAEHDPGAAATPPLLPVHVQGTARALPKTPLGQAIGYALNNWEALCRYLEQGVPSDR